MFKSRTLFVVGAGASKEVGLPIGLELKDQIAERLAIQYEYGYQQIAGDRVITEALRRYVQQLDGRDDINPYITAGWAIADGMPQAASIDNFLDAHREDERVILMGKLAIARSILEAERASLLYVNEGEGTPMDFRGTAMTWFNAFFQLLCEGIGKRDVARVFQNLSFVTFNYDRCIEHYLVHALRNYFRIDENNAQDLVKNVTVLHPYGVVGRLPWQDGKAGISFGESVHATQLIDLAREIKTFTERIDDPDASAAIKKEVAQAEVVAFLGFAFNDMNMELLRTDGLSKARRVFATTFGISQSDSEIVERRIIETLRPDNASGLRRDLKAIACSGLFAEYSRSLSA